MLIVYQREPVAPLADTAGSEIWGAVYDAVAGAFAVAPFPIRTGANRDHERPSVNQASGSHDWVVAWQEYSNNLLNDDWEVVLRSVNGTGALGSTVAAYENGFDNIHTMAPQIAGGGNRYLVTYAARFTDPAQPKPSDDRGRWVRSQRFDYDLVAGTGVRVGLPYDIRFQSLGQDLLAPGGIAFDYVSTDHWCATVLDHAALDYTILKLGHRGRPTESFTYPLLLTDEPSAIAVAFDQARQFPIVYSVVTAGADRTAASTMTYEPVAPPTLLGSACGSGVWAGLTQLARKQAIGSQALPLQLAGAPVNSVAMLFVSTGELAIPTDAVGAPGCVLYPDLTVPNYLGGLGASIAGGFAATSLDLTEPLPNMTLTLQWIYLVPGANALDLLASQGLRLELKH